MQRSTDEILITSPHPALRAGGHVFRETVYGIVKRLVFFFEHIERERKQLGLAVDRLQILDVGCGTGINVAIPLAEAGYSVIGIDPDRASIDRARKTAANLPNARFVTCHLGEWEHSGLFHAVICSEVLEHLEKPGKLVHQMQHVLEDDGLLLVTVPNGYGYFELESAIERVFPKLPKTTDEIQHMLVRKYAGDRLRQRHEYEWTPEHVQLSWPTLAASEDGHRQRFTPGSIRQLLTAEGFEIIEFRNRSFLAGNILNSLVRDWDSFIEWNCSIADRLPHQICSDWMIAARSPGRTASRALAER